MAIRAKVTKIIECIIVLISVFVIYLQSKRFPFPRTRILTSFTFIVTTRFFQYSTKSPSLDSPSTNVNVVFRNLIPGHGATDRIRTCTPFRELVSQTSASTSSATVAYWNHSIRRDGPITLLGKQTVDLASVEETEITAHQREKQARDGAKRLRALEEQPRDVQHSQARGQRQDGQDRILQHINKSHFDLSFKYLEEAVGFEPTRDGVSAPTCFRDRRRQPLGYASKITTLFDREYPRRRRDRGTLLRP